MEAYSRKKRELELDRFIQLLLQQLKLAPFLLKKRSLLAFRIFTRLFKFRKFACFVQGHSGIDKNAFDFIEDLLEEIDLSYSISNREKQNIPDHGPLLVLANHPLGGLEGLLIAKALSELRSDILIASKDPIMRIPNLAPLCIGNDDRDDIGVEIEGALKQGKAIVIFPTQRISIREEIKWKKEFLEYAKRCQTDILPVFVKGRNSELYNFLRFLKPSLNRDLLIRELFNKAGQSMLLRVGSPIGAEVFGNLKNKTALKLLRRHIHAIGRGKKGYFKTKKSIIHRVDRQRLRESIFTGEVLGYTESKAIILLLNYQEAPVAMKELARLRESTFRMVGEGTGQKQDIDKYDRYYKHIVLWDDREMEIIGAYRIGIGKEIMADFGSKGFYSNSLFTYNHELESLLSDAVECGRSFVQPKYWNSMALDYLWHGIGAYLANNPQIKYLYGPVSLSRSLPKEARDMLVYFYSKWFGNEKALAAAKNPYRFSEQSRALLPELFPSDDYKSEFRTLKQNLRHFGLSVPTLYKQYSELCEEGGFHFLDFSLDPDFGNCVDGLILGKVEKIKQKKRERYIENKFGSGKEAPSLSSYFSEV